MRFLIVLALLSHMAFAGPPALAPHRGKDLTVSFPKGWTIAEQDGVYVAQQDPKKKDAAGILFVFIPNPNNSSEEALLDAMTAQVAKDLKVVKKDAIQGGTGHYEIADATSEGVKVRLAAIAVTAGGKAIVCVMVAKVNEFDGLGGLALVTSVLQTFAPDQPAQPAPSKPAAPVGDGTYAQATQGGKLTVPPPTRALTPADLAGEWSQDDHVITNYVSASTGSYAGYSAIATKEKWVIDGKGNFSSKFTGTVAGRGGAYQVNENNTGTISISADGDLTIARKGAAKTHYQIRGWEVRSDIAVLKLNGPYYDEGIPARIKNEPEYGYNLNSYWFRTTKK